MQEFFVCNFHIYLTENQLLAHIDNILGILIIIMQTAHYFKVCLRLKGKNWCVNVFQNSKLYVWCNQLHVQTKCPAKVLEILCKCKKVFFVSFSHLLH